MRIVRKQLKAAKTERVSYGVGTDDDRGRRYSHNPLKQRLRKRPAWSAQTTPTELGTGSSHVYSGRCGHWVSVWRVGIDDARGSACPSHDIGGCISVARC